MPTLGDLASVIRSKNAGPFQVTIDIMFAAASDYRRTLDSPRFTPAEIALAFKDAYRLLNQRIGIFVNLPMASLDNLSLQKHLDEIGRTEAPAKEPG